MGNLKKPRQRPEAKIQAELIRYLQSRGWYVEHTHGNAFQTGFPDLYCHHAKWGQRWIDVKVAGRYSFTVHQRRKWPQWHQAGIGIWILTGATQAEYDKLFAPPNWIDYWKPKWGDLKPRTTDELLDAIETR